MLFRSNIGNIGTAGIIVSSIATGTAPFTVTSTTQVANLNVATSGVAGYVTAAAQSNITSLGTLSGISVSGNANIGNIGTGGLITATGNITGGNIIGTLHVGNLSGTGNSNVGNIGAGIVTASGNIVGANLVTGGVLAVSGTSQSSIAGNLTMNSKKIGRAHV